MHNIKKIPLFTALRYAPKNLLQILGLSCMSNTFFYAFFAYMPDYLSHYANLSSHQAFWIQSLFLTIMLFLVPLAGVFGDRWGRKKVLIIATSSIVLFTLPCFYLVNVQNVGLIMLSLMIATLISSLEQGSRTALLVEICPVDIRYSGISVAYNLGAAIFGGTCPLIMMTLIQMYTPIAPAYYIILTGGIGLLTTLTLSNHLQKDFSLTTLQTNEVENDTASETPGFSCNSGAG